MIPLLKLRALPWRWMGVLALLAVTFATGWKVANWRRDSMELAVMDAAEKASAASRDAIVSAVQELRPKYVTINRKVEHETRIEPRYLSADCEHTDAVWLQISAAYEALGYPPLDRTGVPAAPAPGG
jgi:hypothetical protein